MMVLGHEKLVVYQKSIEFCAWAGELLDEAPKGKELLISVVSLLVKLIQSGDHNRLYEDSIPYET